MTECELKYANDFVIDIFKKSAHSKVHPMTIKVYIIVMSLRTSEVKTLVKTS